MLFGLALVLLGGLLCGTLAAKLRLPALTGMVLFGVLAGPYAMNWLDPALLDISAELRRIALVIILTRAGLALDLGELRRVGRPAMLLCFVPATCELLGCVLLAPVLLGVTRPEAALLGAVLAAVSPAVVVPRMLRLRAEGHGGAIPQMIMAAASVDDVFVIVVFTALTGVVSGGAAPSALVLLQAPVSIVLGLLAGTAAGLLLHRLFAAFSPRGSVQVLLVLCTAFLFGQLEQVLSERVPFASLLAVMAVGAVLYRRDRERAALLAGKFGELWTAAEIWLFVLVGATVDVRVAWLAGPMAVALIFGALLFRMGGVQLCLLKTPFAPRQRLFCSFAYLPKATVQAAIGAIPLTMGLPCGTLVLTVAVLAILLTAPLGAALIDGTEKKLLYKNA